MESGIAEIATAFVWTNTGQSQLAEDVYCATGFVIDLAG